MPKCFSAVSFYLLNATGFESASSLHVSPHRAQKLVLVAWCPCWRVPRTDAAEFNAASGLSRGCQGCGPQVAIHLEVRPTQHRHKKTQQQYTRQKTKHTSGREKAKHQHSSRKPEKPRPRKPEEFQGSISAVDFARSRKGSASRTSLKGSVQEQRDLAIAGVDLSATEGGAKRGVSGVYREHPCNCWPSSASTSLSPHHSH